MADQSTDADDNSKRREAEQLTANKELIDDRMGEREEGNNRVQGNKNIESKLSSSDKCVEEDLQRKEVEEARRSMIYKFQASNQTKGISKHRKTRKLITSDGTEDQAANTKKYKRRDIAECGENKRKTQTKKRTQQAEVEESANTGSSQQKENRFKKNMGEVTAGHLEKITKLELNIEETTPEDDHQKTNKH